MKAGSFAVFYGIVLCMLGVVLVPNARAAQDPWLESYRFEAQGKYAEAYAALGKLKATRPENEFRILRYAWLHYLLKQHNDAIRKYRRALELNPDSIDARLGLTLPLMAQERWREAALYARQVLEVSPWHYYANLRLLAVEEGQRHWEKLAAHARELSNRYPTDATIRVYLARAEARLGNTAKAMAAYRTVLQRVPGHLEATAFLARASADPS